MDIILNTILETSSVTKTAKEVTLLRKLAMLALCKIMLAPRERFTGLPNALSKELNGFKDEMESNNPFAGKL